MIGLSSSFLVDRPIEGINEHFFSEIFSQERELSDPQDLENVFVFILLNNLKFNAIIIISSLLLSLPVILLLFSNGFLLGDFLISNTNMGLWRLLSLLLPHGIIEIVSILWSAHLSFYISGKIFGYLNGSTELGYSIVPPVLRSIVIIVLLTVIAAFIETYVTVKYISNS